MYLEVEESEKPRINVIMTFERCTIVPPRRYAVGEISLPPELLRMSLLEGVLIIHGNMSAEMILSPTKVRRKEGKVFD